MGETPNAIWERPYQFPVPLRLKDRLSQPNTIETTINVGIISKRPIHMERTRESLAIKGRLG